ncbi:MAG TPA: type II toxin-antitoxin system RelE/ParE family toxin [Roseiarcus sp.]|nr:type II toxin-antitoxin system RelE/ParE family toxin [Roseiarcus sp.]
MPKPRWRIRLGAEAEKDFIRILKSTRERFGEKQVEIYQATLLEALASLADGPDALASVAREEILPGLRTLHVARHGRRGRHFIMYRARAGQVIEVLRILHDAMDLARHAPADLE